MRTRTVCRQYERDLTTRAHLDTFMVAFLFKSLQFRVVWLLVVNIDTLTTSSYNAQENERGLDKWQGQLSIGRKD